MKLPAPEPGLVIHYSYLWHREAKAGREEGAKDRPVALILTVADGSRQKRVYALPVTHRQPDDAEEGVEIPGVVKERLGLDGERSWVVISEANVFVWPGPDIRQIPGKATIAYGFLPPHLFRTIRDRFLALDRARRRGVVARQE